MSAKKDRTGEKFITTEGYIIEIIEYIKTEKCIVRFSCGYEVVSSYEVISKGNIKNPFHPSVKGVGYFGTGKYKSTENKKFTKYYSIWVSMITRCYCKKHQETHPTYKGVTVCEEWCNFQNFAKWFEENYNPKTMEGWQLDKDILVKGNKIYSPETCCFVPHEINYLFTKNNANRGKYPIGVIAIRGKFLGQIQNKSCEKSKKLCNTIEEAFNFYKEKAEKYIKEVADRWRDLIDPRVYQAMYNYRVEITD